MSPREWSDRIRDILDAMTEIQDFVRGMSYEQFESDAKTIKAVLADLVIIGEAVGHLPTDVTSANPGVPWTLMKAMRNRVVHVYFGVDPQIVWTTVTQDLPPLVKPLTSLLERAR